MRNTRLRQLILIAAALAAAGCAPRSIDGTGNHEGDLGAANTPLNRWVDPDYGPGDWPSIERLSAREVSNSVCAQAGSMPNPQGRSDFVWQWGQFLDHDIDLTTEADPTESMPIEVPLGDPFFDPSSTGTAEIDFNRSLYADGTGGGVPRQQMNVITAHIDASNVYGSDPVRAAALRTHDGTGRLRTSAGRLLPYNTGGLPNAGGTGPELFLAGDVRANEQLALTALHTLFVREHNRLARVLRRSSSHHAGEDVYQAARAIVGAQMQVISYREFLPALLGPDALAPYEGYKPDADPRIANVFSAAAYRFGHSMVSPVLLRLDRWGGEHRAGHLPLSEAFFTPERLVSEGGIEPLLRGLAAQTAQALDPLIVNELRNLLFGPPGAGGLDLCALNIQRGRDHGLPGYNEVRVAMGLPAVTSFAELSSHPGLQARFAAVYDHPDEIDVWAGGLAEDLVPDALVGPLIHSVLVRQFERLRDGDLYWFEKQFSGGLLRWLERQTLAKIIRRNTRIRGHQIPHDVFYASSR